ncbi:MAG: hypothetical protein J6V48_11390 [Clostridia bacterium]|nr:hypothetical protein [Clostridia bacterium]
MKKPVRILAVLLALLLLAGAVACATPSETEDTTAQAAPVTDQPGDSSAEETKLQPDLPDVKYDRDFVIASGYVTETKYTSNLIVSDEVTGELINDAVYNRTVTMQERFNVRIQVLDITSTQIINAVNGGERPYDIGSATLSEIISVLTKGAAVDLHTVESVDLEKPWWDQNANDKFAVADKLYYTFSDFFITGIDNTRACFFNKDLAEDLALGNLYELVEPGKWTIDRMQEMCKVAFVDKDNNGKVSSGDQVGIAEAATQFYEAVITGCDMEPTKQGADHLPYYPGNDDAERFTEVYLHILDLFTSDNSYLVIGNTDALNMFTSNSSLFILYTLTQCPAMRKNTEVNFGLLPCPKYDEDQERYMNVSPNGDALFIIPGPTEDVEFSGVMCEAASYYSSSYYSDSALMPSYFDLCLTTRNAPDVESSKNLQIIHDNIAYTSKVLGTTYMQGIYDAFASENRNIASVLSRLNRVNVPKIKEILAPLGVIVD